MNSKTVFFAGLLVTLWVLIGSGLAQVPDKKGLPVSQKTTVAYREKTASSANELIDLNIPEYDIRKLISKLAMQWEINVVMANNVTGDISVHLHQVTLEEALDAITLAGGFAYQKHDDLYYIYKPKKARDPQSARLQMRVFKVKYGEIGKVQEVLDAFPEKGLIKTHKPSRSIIVQDTPENIEKIETLISFWDTPPKQVMIEAKILEVTLTEDMSLGINWEKILGDVRIGTGGLSAAVMPSAAAAASAAAISPIPATGSGIFGNIITGAGSRQQFAAAVDALQTKTRVNTLSTPKILAIHGEEARVQVGGQQGYRVTTVSDGIATEGISFIDTGTILQITPFIKDDDNILLNVKPSIKSATIEGGIPVVNTTDVSTWLLAKNGETVFIGGLIRDTKSRTREMIPCLGSIPLIGVLFARVFYGIGKSELVVLITPQILNNEVKQKSHEAREKVGEMQKILKKDLLHPHKKIFETAPK